MKSIIQIAFMLLFSTITTQLFAQESKGQVVDKEGFPLPGVNVINQKASLLSPL